MGPPIFIGGNGQDAEQIARRLWASMGPPIFIGGNTIRRPRPTLFCSLQWGRRFSSAEIGNLPRKRKDRGSFNGAADFHRRKYAGRRQELIGAVVASMGPPIFIGGNMKAGARRGTTRKASMGPPIFIGGNGGQYHGVQREEAMLQWGRRFSSAEMLK